MNWLYHQVADIVVPLLWQVEALGASHHLLPVASLACHAALWFGASGPCL